MKVIRMVVLCWCAGVLVASRVLAVGFDARGAQEAAGLSREFDDATRLQQLQQAPKLPPPPLVTVTKPTPPSEQQAGDPSVLLQTDRQMSSEQAKQVLEQAEHQLQQERQGGFWHTTWRFLLWSSIGAALSWAVWNWIVRRASDGLKID